jgi:GntR family transcriptional repressor for pyruvate dehydrogenase complex
MPVSLHPIQPKSIAEQVFEQLRDLIFRGYFKPGEKLPPERELAASLSVSRPTIKTAITKLVNKGLVEQRQGQGSFVRSQRSQYMDNPLREVMDSEEVDLDDLLEVRSGLEVNAVRLAAERATPEDISILDSCLQDMLSKVDQGQVGADEDVAFHMAIAYATKNPAQVFLMKHFYDLLFYGIKESRFHLYESGNLPQMGEQHAAILDRIRHHDPDGAQEAMLRHIHFVQEFCHERGL